MPRKWTDEQRAAMSAAKSKSWQERKQAKMGETLAVVAPVTPEMPQFTAQKGEPAEHGFVAKGHQPARDEPSPQAPPRNLFSGTMKKLDVFGKPGTDPNEPIPGHVLYWFDDIEGGMIIQQAKASGYSMVRKDEVALNDANTSPGNNDLGGDVRRWVSQGPDGSAIYSYLMKKPKWLHELHQTGPDSLEQRVHKQIEQQLKQGTFNANPNDRRYSAGTPGVMTNLPPISLGSYGSKPQS